MVLENANRNECLPRTKQDFGSRIGSGNLVWLAFPQIPSWRVLLSHMFVNLAIEYNHPIEVN